MVVPYGVLRVGYPYYKTIGMRRLTNWPISVAVGDDDNEVHILCKGDGITFIRRLTLNDDDKGAFNLNGGPAAIGGPFIVDGDFSSVSGMIKDKEGNLVFSDEGNHKISKVSIEGKVINQWGNHGNKDGELNRPGALAEDPEGNLLISDSQNHRIQKFDPEGNFIFGFGSYGSEKGQFNTPWGIDVDLEGFIFVADWRNDRIQKFDSEGNFVSTIGKGSGSGEGELNRPAAVKVDEDGDIYIADWANHRIQLFAHDGHFVEKFIGDATLSDQARNYMITNMLAMRVREMTSIEPQKRLRWPASVTVKNGFMFIPDYGSARIQIYKKDVLRLSEGEIAEKPRSHSLYTQF